jgi:glycosyltransferase involved in cell wall biosynthesis
VALVHDWLNGMRGGERCLELLAKEWPEAPIYTLLYRPELVSAAIRAHRVVESRLGRIPGFREKYRWFLPLFPGAIEAMRAPEGTRLVVSTSHCVAKGFKKPSEARHLCYCFTPMRYAWGFQDDYFGRGGLKRRVIDFALARLRKWDAESAGRVDRFVAISEHVRERIARHYGRRASVVYPPVNAGFYTPAESEEAARRGAAAALEAGGMDVAEAERTAGEGYDLVVSALVPYKRIDLAVESARATGRMLVVAGAGSELGRLRAGAPGNVKFAGRPDDAGVRALYRGCRCLVFPGEEDFGIVPLEAMACGRPVLAYGRGGALETVKDGVSGLFFAEQTADALSAALSRADAAEWDAAAIRAHAEPFGEERFLREMRREAAAALGDDPEAGTV